MSAIKIPVSQGKFLNSKWIYDAEDVPICRCEDESFVPGIVHALNAYEELSRYKKALDQWEAFRLEKNPNEAGDPKLIDVIEETIRMWQQLKK